MPKPVMITSPMSKRLTAPGPLAISSGTMATSIATVVMRMGRRRMVEARSTASRLLKPSRVRNWLANSTMSIPFLVTSPIRVMRPTCV